VQLRIGDVFLLDDAVIGQVTANTPKARFWQIGIFARRLLLIVGG
jgi:hypothetical protein